MTGDKTMTGDDRSPHAPVPLREETRPGGGAASQTLDAQLCFALQSTTQALGRVYARKLAPFGLTYTQYLVLLVLWERGEASVKDLGAALFLDSGTLTPVLKRLEAAGHVTRRRDAADERRVLVSLSASGQALQDALASLPGEIAALGADTGVDLARLKRDLESLRAALVASADEA